MGQGSQQTAAHQTGYPHPTAGLVVKGRYHVDFGVHPERTHHPPVLFYRRLFAGRAHLLPLAAKRPKDVTCWFLVPSFSRVPKCTTCDTLCSVPLRRAKRTVRRKQISPVVKTDCGGVSAANSPHEVVHVKHVLNFATTAFAYGGMRALETLFFQNLRYYM